MMPKYTGTENKNGRQAFCNLCSSLILFLLAKQQNHEAKGSKKIKSKGDPTFLKKGAPSSLCLYGIPS